MGFRGMYGRERAFQPDMQRAVEDCKGRISSPAGMYKEFTPMDISGLVDWHRADMGVTLVGSKVSAWADQSGSEHHLTQSTDARRLDYVLSSLNGQPVLRPGIAGDDRFMNWTAWVAPSKCTVFMVVRYRVKGAAFQAAVLAFSGGSNFSGLYLGATVSGNKPLIYILAETAAWSSALTDQTAYLVKWNWDDTTETCRTQVGGGTEVSAVAGAAFTVGSFTTLGIDPVVDSSQDLYSDIAEVLIYNRRLSPEEEATIRGYILTRYGV